MEYKKIRLKDVVISANTGADAIQRAPIVDFNTGKKCLRIGDISNHREYENWGFTNVNDENYEKYKLEKDDILIARTGSTIGINKFFDRDLEAVYNNGLIRLKVNRKKYNSKYIYYNLQTSDFRNFIDTIAFGTTGQPNIKINDLLTFKIVDLSLETQNKLVDIIDKLDKKIELNNQVNNNLHELAENMFKQIYENGIDCKLSKLVSNISTGSRPKGGAKSTGIPSIGAEKIEKFGVYNYASEKYISEEYFNKLKNGIVKSGDVLLYKDGAYTGKVSMALNGFPYEKCAVNEHVFVINTMNNWAKYYLYFTLYSQENRNKIFTMASSKAAQPGLNQTELKSLEIKLAKKSEIIKFEKDVEPIMFKIAYNTLQNKTLEQLRDTLLPNLLNGKIELRYVST